MSQGSENNKPARTPMQEAIELHQPVTEDAAKIRTTVFLEALGALVKEHKIPNVMVVTGIAYQGPDPGTVGYHPGLVWQGHGPALAQLLGQALAGIAGTPNGKGIIVEAVRLLHSLAWKAGQRLSVVGKGPAS